MKNIKGIPRKTKYEVQSIEVLGFDLLGYSVFMGADYALKRNMNADGVSAFVRKMLLSDEQEKLDGLKPYLITVRVPVRQHGRKNRSHKPNDMKDRTISTLAIDEIEAYNIAKKTIQEHWQVCFKLNRYAKR